MAEMTSSSVTSSAVPAKLVVRRSMRMARSLSALPRKALMSWRRSTSLRGRKSMALLPSGEKETGLPKPLTLSREFREEQIHATIQPLLFGVHAQHIIAPQQEVG